MKITTCVLAGGLAVVGVLLGNTPASAVPTPACTLTTAANLTVTGGTAALVGQTVCQQDKVYTNFVFSSTMAAAVSTSQFNLYAGFPNEIHELVFLGAFNAGSSYSFSYDFYLNPATVDFANRNIVQASLSYTSPLQSTATFSKDIKDGATLTLIDVISTTNGARDDSNVFSSKWIHVSATLTIPGSTGGISTLSDSYVQSVQSIPEPVSLAALGVGLAGLGFAARRRRAV